MSRVGAVAILEPRSRLRAHLASVLEGAGYRVATDTAEADACLYAADGPDAVDAPSGTRLALVFGVVGDDTPHIRRPFSPAELVHRLDDLLGSAFRGGTTPMANGPKRPPAGSDASALARCIAAEVPALAELSEDARAARIEELLTAGS